MSGSADYTGEAIPATRPSPTFFAFTSASRWRRRPVKLKEAAELPPAASLSFTHSLGFYSLTL